jgi:hypothetical protein
MELRFESQEIMKWARQYSENMSPQEEVLIGVRSLPLATEYLSLPDLEKVVQWKSPRSVHWIQPGQEQYIREVTRFALSTPSERARIEVFTLLDGVGWPTASVILHFYHPEPYPILDFRALWSVGIDLPPNYNFAFWKEYVKFCREVAKETQVSMRELDQALWQFSKTNQLVDKIE